MRVSRNYTVRRLLPSRPRSTRTARKQISHSTIVGFIERLARSGEAWSEKLIHCAAEGEVPQSTYILVRSTPVLEKWQKKSVDFDMLFFQPLDREGSPSESCILFSSGIEADSRHDLHFFASKQELNNTWSSSPSVFIRSGKNVPQCHTGLGIYRVQSRKKQRDADLWIRKTLGPRVLILAVRTNLNKSRPVASLIGQNYSDRTSVTCGVRA